MTDPIEFAMSEATDDVVAAIRWLLGSGFEVVGDSGPPYSSFGFYVDLEDARLQARLTLDRSQWHFDLGYKADPRIYLWVLQTAMSGTDAETPPKTDLGAPLPDVLPEGVSWADTIPEIVRWMEADDRRKDLSRAAASCRKAMLRYWRT